MSLQDKTVFLGGFLSLLPKPYAGNTYQYLGVLEAEERLR